MTDGADHIEFDFQDPLATGRTLLDAIVEAAQDAESGGGIFAFASVRGIAMLLDATVVKALAENGKLELFVGIDAITNPGALQSLAKREEKRSGLTARVVAHDLASLFHPKICWFAHGDRLVLLVGSGNLTPGGLKENIEAFAVLRLQGANASSAMEKISSWIERWQPHFLPPDDPRAIELAKRNSGAERSLRKSMRTQAEFPVGTPPTDEESVLVVEISRNAPKRSQLEVGRTSFYNFFGGGTKKKVLIQFVKPDGTLYEVERRALIRTKSSNFRIETSGGRGIKYPAKGRPIALFAKMPGEVFRCCLLQPGDSGHLESNAFLTERAGAFASKMRRETTTPTELLLAWPDSPLLKD